MLASETVHDIKCQVTLGADTVPVPTPAPLAEVFPWPIREALAATRLIEDPKQRIIVIDSILAGARRRYPQFFKE